jgi:hypothetical protein
MEQLEVVKENVMPLRRGRTVAAAAAAAEGGEREHARQLESERRCARARSARKRLHTLTRPRSHVACAAPSKRSSRRTTATTHWLSGFGAPLVLQRPRRACLRAVRPRSYVTWTQQHYPAGGPESQLLATLEKCTRTLLPIERYKTDVRYLRVWVQYVRTAASLSHEPRSRAANHAQADCCNEPKDIFDFMEVRHPAAGSWHSRIVLTFEPASFAAPRHWAGVCALLRSSSCFP